MGSTLFRDPQARSSALAALGTLQPRAFGSLNRVDPLDSVSNYYIGNNTIMHEIFFTCYTNRTTHCCHVQQQHKCCSGSCYSTDHTHHNGCYCWSEFCTFKVNIEICKLRIHKQLVSEAKLCIANEAMTLRARLITLIIMYAGGDR